ncbi:MAG: hypothetical protein PHF26_01940 [Candidatus Gracilibacteria bacterium]|nr:hypothetical protein [Candidatus Gracilibacteria bacterium]
MISIYSPDYDGRVYCNSCYRSDNWNPFSYAKKYDCSKTFFEQFQELYKNVPKLGLNIGVNMENCDYNNHIGYSNNCYLCFGVSNCDNCFYVHKSSLIENSIDISNSDSIIKSYFVIDSSNIYGSFFIEKSANISESYFINSCENIQNGIFCVNMKNKKYVYKNKEISHEEYKKILALLKEKLKSHAGLIFLQKEFDDFKKQFPIPSLNISNSENCLGDNISNSKNCVNCFGIINSEDCTYVYDTGGANDCMDMNFSGNIGERQTYSFELIAGAGGNRVYFSENIFGNMRNIFYCSGCFNNSEDLFGCVDLKNKHYCILNKQYSKEEYEIEVSKIIQKMEQTGEWGEFFPASISPFGYNETVAFENFPMVKDGAISKGYKWQDKDYPVNIPANIEIIKSKDLPDNLDNIDESILNKAISCENSKRLFRLMKSELVFYKLNGIALPRLHPDERQNKRISLFKSGKLKEGKCFKCNKDIISSYLDGKGKNVFCEECYKKELM